MTSDGVLKVSELGSLPLPAEGSSGISSDADNLMRMFDEFAHRHGRVQLGRFMHEFGKRHGMFVALSSRGESAGEPLE